MQEEVMGSGKPANLPGLYEHKESGTRIATTADPDFGRIQADALVQMEYTRVGDVPTKTVPVGDVEEEKASTPKSKG